MADTCLSLFQAAKAAALSVQELDESRRNAVLLRVADSLIAQADALLAANAEDLAAMDRANPLYDRLLLTRQRLEGIAADIRKVASLPSPLAIY